MDVANVERRAKGFYLAGSRVPLDAVVREYWKGEQPESIRAHFPTLSLEQVFGAIAFYLAHRKEVETVLQEREKVEDAFSASHTAPAELRILS